MEGLKIKVFNCEDTLNDWLDGTDCNVIDIKYSIGVGAYGSGTYSDNERVVERSSFMVMYIY